MADGYCTVGNQQRYRVYIMLDAALTSLSQIFLPTTTTTTTRIRVKREVVPAYCTVKGTEEASKIRWSTQVVWRPRARASHVT
jgi:hypothetical protein